MYLFALAIAAYLFGGS